MNENNLDQNHQQDQNGGASDGGLFSDDYETPKKENPYLKKNREKAAAKVAQGAAQESHPKPVREKRMASVEAEPSAGADDGRGYTHKRTFSDWIFEHVKLIATIATVLVVLSLVLITDVVGMVEDLIVQSQQADKEEVSLTYVKGLTEKASPITWTDLEKYRRDESKADDSVTWMLSVKGTSYEVWISGVSTSRPPTYVYLYDMKTGDRMALGADNFDEFIGAHP